MIIFLLILILGVLCFGAANFFGGLLKLAFWLVVIVVLLAAVGGAIG